jgi:hypothetical protein
MAKKLGVLLYENVQPMDVIGPWEVLAIWKNVLQAPIASIESRNNHSMRSRVMPRMGALRIGASAPSARQRLDRQHFFAGERKVAAGKILLHVLSVGGAGQWDHPDRLREAEHHLSMSCFATCGDAGDEWVPQDLRVGGE